MADAESSARRPRRPRDIGALLADESVRLDRPAASRDDAIRLVGRALVECGAVEPSYIEAMIERENAVSTYLGDAVALPRATFAAEGSVARDAIALVRFAGDVDWDGHAVRVAVGIAAVGRGHIGILSRLASVLLEPSAADALTSAASISDIRSVLTPRDTADVGPPTDHSD